MWRVGMVGRWSVCPAFGTGCRRVRDLPTWERKTVLIWVRRRFKCGGCGGAHVERLPSSREIHYAYGPPRRWVCSPDGAKPSWPGSSGAPPDHLSPTRTQPPSPDKPSTPTGYTQEIKPIPRKTHPRPGRNPPPRPPRTHPQTLANLSGPNQNHPSIAPQRPAKKGHRAGRPPLTRNLGGGGGWMPTPLAAQPDTRRRKRQGDQNDHAKMAPARDRRYLN